MHINRWVAASFIGLVMYAVVFAGCLGAKTPPVSRPPAPTIFLDYYRTGGSTGTDDRLVIFDNGAAIVSTKAGSKAVVLNATEIATITGLFTDAQFSMLQLNYPAPHGGGSDLTKYSISFHGKTVTTEDSAVPPPLLPVIDELNGIVRSAGIGTQAA